MKLLKYKVFFNDNPEVHFHLGFALQTAMSKSSSSPKMMQLMTKMEELKNLPAGERDKKFQEFLRNSNESQFQDINRVMVGEYPFWIREEMTAYIEKDPNGRFATQANQLLATLANVLPKK